MDEDLDFKDRNGYVALNGWYFITIPSDVMRYTCPRCDGESVPRDPSMVNRILFGGLGRMNAVGGLKDLGKMVRYPGQPASLEVLGLLPEGALYKCVRCGLEARENELMTGEDGLWRCHSCNVTYQGGEPCPRCGVLYALHACRLCRGALPVREGRAQAAGGLCTACSSLLSDGNAASGETAEAILQEVRQGVGVAEAARRHGWDRRRAHYWMNKFKAEGRLPG